MKWRFDRTIIGTVCATVCATVGILACVANRHLDVRAVTRQRRILFGQLCILLILAAAVLPFRCRRGFGGRRGLDVSTVPT